jgi:hypothetical protein
MGRDLTKDKELEMFRSQMEVPSKFEEGFSWSSVIGALFVGLLMSPGATYMQLLAGTGVGPAAQWVTVILFIEVARRAHRNLPRAEVFVLFYMASAVIQEPFAGLIYSQFFAQSRAAVATGVAERLPIWYAPSDPRVLAERNFFMIEWAPAVALIVFQQLMGRLNSTVLSYGFFRLGSDIEKLPFPMAPVGAQGVLALVEQQAEEGSGKKTAADNWRWRVFSIGGVLGLVFGFLYMGLPALSEAILGRQILIFPIPFVDWTDKTAEFLPAAAMGLSLNFGQLIFGMVMPFFAMVGSMAGMIITLVANPLLYKAGVLTTWKPGDDTVRTLFVNNIDFYFSFAIGVSLALALIGLYQVVKGIRATRKKRREAAHSPLEHEKYGGTPEGRGDFPGHYVLLVYVFTSMTYILLSGWLMDWHRGVMAVLIFFAYLYTPVISYVTTRLEGMVGEVVQIPFVREASFILSGYTGGVKVWFLPLPMADFGSRTRFWRQTELTGTKFTSIWKAEIVLVPIILLFSILFSQFIWRLNPVPSPAYPYTERMWELQAANQCIILTSTLGRYSTFEQSFRPLYIAIGCGLGLGVFGVANLFAAPVTLMYGLVRGLNQTLPHVVQTQFIGALIGRYYFQKRFGLKWRQYIPVVAAGFSCGMGLITVFAVGVNFLAKSVISIPF